MAAPPDPDKTLVGISEQGELPGEDAITLFGFMEDLQRKFRTAEAVIAPVKNITHWFACKTRSGKFVIYFGTPESLNQWRFANPENPVY